MVHKVINHYRIWWIKFIRGFILISLAGDSLSLHELIANASEIQHSPLFIFAMVLIMLGAFTKSAQVPFYIWLPDAMEAPTPVSAYLHSATMVKSRIIFSCSCYTAFAISQGWIWTITLVGLITLFWASLNATKQQDLKGILASLNSISTWHDYVDVRYWCRKLSFRGKSKPIVHWSDFKECFI